MHNVYDVIIIGSGPSGLLCAIWLARCGVSVGVFEKQDKRPPRGRADGFEPRTLEILNSFGLLDSWWRHANRTMELAVWVARTKEKLERILRQGNSSQETSDFYEVTMDQAVLERSLEDDLLATHGIAVDYGCECLKLAVNDTDAEPEDYPVHLKVKQGGIVHRTSARYAVGADGAHSWTRQQAGIGMDRSRTAQCWGVADVHPLTNFPDIRSRCIIHAEGAGTLHFIPRERGMVRIYVQLGEKETNADVSDVVVVSRRILSPYNFDFKHCYWSSRYWVQQGLATRMSAFKERVFLIGDAVHTHSPKAGMGLNISMQDAYNLGFKLAAVIRNNAPRCLLATYEEERRPVAEFLVDFDQRFLGLFHSPLSEMSIDAYRKAVIEATTEEHSQLSGVSACYSTGSMFTDTRMNQQSLAPGVIFGARIPSGLVVNHVDGRPVSIHNLIPSTGQWRLIVFPGNLQDSDVMQRYIRLGRELQDWFQRSTDSTASSVLGLAVLTIHRSPRHEVELLSLPAIYHPWNGEYGWDYNKVFTDEGSLHNPASTGRVYEKTGISGDGCVLLVRPDQHVCMIASMETAAQKSAQILEQWCGMGSKQTPNKRGLIRAAL